jgi:outer membrane protein TolC
MDSIRCAVLLTAACAGAGTPNIDDGRFLGGAPAQAAGELRAEDERALATQPTAELLLRLARSRSPALLEARQRAAARARRADAESALPAPRLTYEQWHIPLARPWALDEAMMIMVGLEQEIPAPGSRGARAEAVRAEAGALAAEAAAHELELARRLKRAFVDYQHVRREIALHEEHRVLAGGLVDATRSLYAAGRGSQQDVLRAELQATRLHAELLALRQHERSLRALLNSLVSRPSEAPLGEPPPLVPVDGAVDRAKLEGRIERRPELAAAGRRVERARAERRAAERESLWPSFEAGAEWMFAPEPQPGGHRHGYGVMVSMSLPWLSGRGRAEARAAAEEVRAEEQAVAAARTSARYELAEAAAHVEAARETLATLEREILPRAERAWESARSAFAAGRGGAIDVLGALDAWLEARLEHLRAQAELAGGLVDLERATGGAP